MHTFCSDHTKLYCRPHSYSRPRSASRACTWGDRSGSASEAVGGVISSRPLNMVPCAAYQECVKRVSWQPWRAHILVVRVVGLQHEHAAPPRPGVRRSRHRAIAPAWSRGHTTTTPRPRRRAVTCAASCCARGPWSARGPSPRTPSGPPGREKTCQVVFSTSIPPY